MKKIRFITTIICFFLLISFHLLHALEHSYLDYYKNVCKEVIDSKFLTTNSINQELLLKKVEEMFELGVIIAETVNIQDPECRQILNLFIQDSEIMENLSLIEIEELYHEGGIVQKKGLTGIDYHNKKHKECMEITHLIVHPATVKILLKYYNNDHEKNHIKKIKEELEMLNNHIKSHEDHH